MTKEARPVLLYGLIINLIALSLYLLELLRTIILVFVYFRSKLNMVFPILTFLIFVLVIVFVALILNTISIKQAKKAYKDYQTKKGLILTLIIISTLVALFELLWGPHGYKLIINKIIFILFITGILLMLIGYKKGLKPSKDVIDTNPNVNMIYQHIEQLAKLKDEAVITEEEFLELKTKHLNNLKRHS